MWPNKTVHTIRPVALASVVAVLAFFDFSSTGVAQETASDRQSNVIDEIIVTARRREESLWSVPGSVSAFSERQLRDLQATDMRQVQYAVPNFHFQRSDSSNAAVYLRGIGQNDSLALCRVGRGRLYRRRIRGAQPGRFRGTVRHRARRGSARAARNALRAKLPRRRSQADHSSSHPTNSRRHAELGAGKSQRHPDIQRPHQRTIERRRPLEREDCVLWRQPRRPLRECGAWRYRRRHQYAVVSIRPRLRGRATA